MEEDRMIRGSLMKMAELRTWKVTWIISLSNTTPYGTQSPPDNKAGFFSSPEIVYFRTNIGLNKCQPWTIVVTGLSIVACSWVILHSVLVSSLAVALIGAWWYIFLYSYPKSYSEMIAERRARVADGFEDIYGKNKKTL
ncbi:hypothetical protein F2Q70_00016716 [Brassica cretica]|uniref:DUF6737 domain-containing protein n=1 Tax=Brassica cretica TaxID=69181 RepID=A0A8S9HWC6_BRACR|nr:hypothetical protein F2Q70_00016716 [Brassica cretica]